MSALEIQYAQLVFTTMLMSANLAHLTVLNVALNRSARPVLLVSNSAKWPFKASAILIVLKFAVTARDSS